MTSSKPTTPAPAPARQKTTAERTIGSVWEPFFRLLDNAVPANRLRPAG